MRTLWRDVILIGVLLLFGPVTLGTRTLLPADILYSAARRDLAGYPVWPPGTILQPLLTGCLKPRALFAPSALTAL